LCREKSKIARKKKHMERNENRRAISAKSGAGSSATADGSHEPAIEAAEDNAEPEKGGLDKEGQVQNNTMDAKNTKGMLSVENAKSKVAARFSSMSSHSR